MNNVLVINASVISKSNSVSYKTLTKFLSIYKAKNPNDKIVELDLGDSPIANTTLNETNFEQFFNQSKEFIDQLKWANKVVFVCPMINLSISGLAKNYFDHIIVARQTFTYEGSTDGLPIGMLKHLKVQLITTSGSDASTYGNKGHTEQLKQLWSFIGANVVEPIWVSGVKASNNINKSVDEIISKYDEQIQKLANIF